MGLLRARRRTEGPRGTLGGGPGGGEGGVEGGGDGEADGGGKGFTNTTSVT